jgi:hypothetical protein
MVSESYPGELSKTIDTCTNIQGVINVTNLLGEDNEAVPLLSVCRQTCPMEIVTDATVNKTFVPVCAIGVSENATATISCPNGGVIDDIPFARFGLDSDGTCQAGFANIFCAIGNCNQIHPFNCGSNVSRSVVRRECLGKKSCQVEARSTKFGGDPCNGLVNMLTIQAVCRIETIVHKNARVDLDLRVGYPNRIDPYMKTLVTRMQVLGYINDVVIVWCFMFD